MVNLNRCQKIEIDDETPDVVLMDLVFTCGKKVPLQILRERREDVIEIISSFKKELDPCEPDLQALARYVSPESQKWATLNLWRAFCHLDRFIGTVQIVITKHQIGPKSDQNPFHFDSIMLYKILQVRKLSYSRDDTLEDMRKRINQDLEKKTEEVVEKILRPKKKESLKISDLVDDLPVNGTLTGRSLNGRSSETLDLDRDETINYILDNLKSQDLSTIQKIASLIKKKPAFEASSFKFDPKDIQKLNPHSSIYNSCLDDQEAVVHAMHFFKIDIRESEDPVEELKKYCLSKIEKKKYKPASKRFREKYLKNPVWYNTSKTWKPAFRDLYDQRLSSKIIAFNGGDEDDSLEFFEKIKGDNTFYLGVPPHLQEKDLISFLKNEDLSSNENVISYGKGDDFIYFTPKELVEYLEKEKDFNDFKNKNRQIPFHAIRKLRNICKGFSGEEDYSNLREKIQNTTENGDLSFPLLKDLLSYYLEYQMEFERIFLNLDRLGKGLEIEKRQGRIKEEKVGGEVLKMIKSLPIVYRKGGRYWRRNQTFYSKIDGVTKEDKDLIQTASFYYEKLTGKKIEDI
jgi:uncharacterized protein YlzI (FlbEa/FlbD family)